LHSQITCKWPPIAGHRDSYDHDHVLANLADHFDAVLDAIDEYYADQHGAGDRVASQLTRQRAAGADTAGRGSPGGSPQS